MAIDISKMFQKPSAVEFNGNASVEAYPKSLNDNTTNNTVRIVIITVVTFSILLSPRYTHNAMSAARKTHVNGNDIGRLRLARAVAPCEFKTATHATS